MTWRGGLPRPSEQGLSDGRAQVTALGGQGKKRINLCRLRRPLRLGCVSALAVGEAVLTQAAELTS